MPHRNSTRSYRNRYGPSVCTSSSSRNGLRSTAQSGQVSVPSSTAIKIGHIRRNSMPNKSGSLTSSTSTTTASWGSMFDFTSILFPTKKSQLQRVHPKQCQQSNSYIYPIDLSAISTSPSNSSCSQDEDYSGSNSSSSIDRMYDIKRKFSNEYDDNLRDSTYNNSPKNIIQSRHHSSYVSRIDDCSTSNNVPTFAAEKSIAERWISMVSEPLPETRLPIQYENQYLCEEGIEITRIASYDDLQYSVDSDDSQKMQFYRIMTDSPYETEMKSTPRYTNDLQNFQCGIQIGSITRNGSPFSEQHRYNTCTSSHQQSDNTRAEYTAQDSNSSRGVDQHNKGQSHSSFHQSTASGGGGGVSEEHSSGASGSNKMSENDENSLRSSDDGNESLSDLDDTEEEEKLRKEATYWKTAVDPKSARTYYYNTQTLETQWRKPLCCASPSERRATIKKEKQTLAFFASMEQNILRSMQQGQQNHSTYGPSHRHNSMVATSPVQISEFTEHKVSAQQRRESEPPTSFQHPLKLVRTISSMEDSVLAALIQRVPSFRNTTSTSKSNESKIGCGATFTPYSQQRAAVTEAASDDHDDSSDDIVQRMSVRENSLPFGAIFDATKSQRRVRLEANNDSNSFNFSALMRMNSVHNSKFNMFDHIPEEENEDNSESCCIQFESSELSPGRGNKSLSRQSGSINLNKSKGLIANDIANVDDNDEEEVDDTTNQFSYRDSLRRMNGSLALRVEMTDDSKNAISRENSLNLSEIVSQTRQLKRDPSFALQDAEHWGSYLSESAMRGLSIDEGEAMLELASITDRMGGIHSDTSDSSENSEEGTKLYTENVEPRFHGNAAIAIETHGMNSSDTVGWNATPELFANNPPRRETSVSFRPSMIRPTSLRNTPSVAIMESVATKKPNVMSKPTISRRNTCGTLYVGSTLSAPDKDATIKCVCAVFRAHIVQSTYEVDEIDVKYKVFDDLGSNTDESIRATLELPTLEDVSVFYRDVFSRAQMESDCIIISLIYVERLIKVTDGALRPRITNWRSILFSCMVMASKVWDDLSMWNADFSHTCPAGVEFQLSRINELEIAMLSSLQYKVKVPASEYAKYYFLLRSMLIKSGLGSDDLKAINPLDVEGAKQLQHISSQYQASVALMSDRQKMAMGRSKTTGGSHVISGQYSNDGSLSSNSSTPNTSPASERQKGSKVGLEHMVQL